MKKIKVLRITGENGWTDLELADAGDVGQPRLDVGQVGHFDGRRERVPLLPQQPPARETVAVVGQVHVVLRADVDGQDVLGTAAAHHVGCVRFFGGGEGGAHVRDGARCLISSVCVFPLTFVIAFYVQLVSFSFSFLWSFFFKFRFIHSAAHPASLLPGELRKVARADTQIMKAQR